MLCVRRWSDAGPVGRVRCWQVQCREPKTGQQKAQLNYMAPVIRVALGGWKLQQVLA